MRVRVCVFKNTYTNMYVNIHTCIHTNIHTYILSKQFQHCY